MELSFLGGANTVTGSRFLLTSPRARVLIDCGMFQGSPNEQIRNRVPLGIDARKIDAILITHAHLDHCGLLPLVVRDGFRGPIFLTSATAELAEIVLLDSGRLQQEFAKRRSRWARRNAQKAIRAATEAAARLRAAMQEAMRARRRDRGSASAEPGGVRSSNPETALLAQPAHVEAGIEAPLYTERDAKLVPPLFRPVRYGEDVEVAPGVRATFADAGHILGSAIIRVTVQEDGGGKATTIVFSGDLGRPSTPILRDPAAIREADYLVVESTYGGREHEPSEEAIRLLAETVRAVAESDGVLLIPSFAIGRTQEVVWELDRLIERGEIPMLPLYLDSPMASRASEVYRRHPEFYDEETRKLLAGGNTPLDYPDQRITRSVEDSKAIATADRPYMIVASNGMLTGGRVVAHLRNLIDDPRATILFVGYQGQGTLGAHLQAGATTVRLDGQIRRVRCRVRSISGFSAHADESELLDWIGNFAGGRQPGERGAPRTVFLVHGDPDAQLAIAPKVEALGLRVHVPHWREHVTLA